ncbi:MAG: SRPBCC family protein [Schleiferiaceae bacterium]|jgi:hypothetical protein|nr:SRPBCC family protein [Schleiferiaceae bacterium]
MTTVNVTKTINVSATEAWNNLSSFKGIEQYSPIASSVTEGEGEGMKRTCTMPDGANIFEVLTKKDSATKEMQYIITEGPFPFTDYVSTVKISGDDNSATINWSCEFNAAEENQKPMQELLGGFYNVIIEGLESHINNTVEA